MKTNWAEYFDLEKVVVFLVAFTVGIFLGRLSTVQDDEKSPFREITINIGKEKGRDKDTITVGNDDESDTIYIGTWDYIHRDDSPNAKIVIEQDAVKISTGIE